MKNTITTSARKLALTVGASCLSMAAAGALFVAPAKAQDSKANDDTTTVVVTGFRSSVQSAISAKRKENGIVDVIKAEDIGQFPDLNLAESLQRIPGVAIDRDGGEGRQITIRGLNSDFSRVRLNGLEALSTTGGKDSSGGTNRGRGFDFNIFASDLFNSLTVRKSMSAEVEEGSLGATVDMQTARPFDYKGFAMASSLQLGYNDLSEDKSPRGTFMISNRWADGRLGALLSVAYSERLIVEEGPNTTRWENSTSAGTAGRYAAYSTNGGTSFTNIAQSGTLTDTNAIKVTNSLHPRIPRYSHFETDQKRLGITGSFQMKPNPDTVITLDGMFAKLGANRDEYEIEAISFSRSGQGLPKTSVYNYTIDDKGTMTKASFNGVDIRSEHRFDEVTTTFTQLNLGWDQNFSEKLTGHFLVGSSKSLTEIPEQTTFTFESYNVNGYSYDYTDMANPVFNYGKSSTGCSPDQACYWQYSSSSSTGDKSLIRLRPQSVENTFTTLLANFNYAFNDNLTLKFGASTKKFGFVSTEFGRYTGTATGTRDENASGTIATTINSNISQFSQLVSVSGNTFLIPNLDAIRSSFDYNCNCTNSSGQYTVNTTNSSSRGNNRDATEKDASYYAQVDFNYDMMGMPVRGNVGVRQVKTEQTVSGLLGTTPVVINRDYSDTLPSFNFVVQPRENVYVRLAAAKTMARPTLTSLSPGGSITTSTKSITSGNPFLDPVRADTFDASFEWYPDKDTLFTVGLFKKDIHSYIQNLVRTIPFGETGLDLSVAAAGDDANTMYTVNSPVNTKGGELQGYELSVNKPLTFLPSFLSKTGVIVNYTHVESDITYILNATTGASAVYPLVGLSPQSWNLTYYYEGDKLSGRISAAHRDEYISQINPGSSADYWGKAATTNIDAQISYKINSHFTVSFEGINLTDAADERYIAYNTVEGNTASDLLYDNSKPGRQFYLGLKYKY